MGFGVHTPHYRRPRGLLAFASIVSLTFTFHPHGTKVARKAEKPGHEGSRMWGILMFVSSDPLSRGVGSWFFNGCAIGLGATCDVKALRDLGSIRSTGVDRSARLLRFDMAALHWID